MTDELKPCPFCGWKAEIKGPDGDTGGMWEISCPNTCRALVVAERRDWAVRRWNTRPIEDELRAENAALKDELKRAAVFLAVHGVEGYTIVSEEPQND